MVHMRTKQHPVWMSKNLVLRPRPSDQIFFGPGLVFSGLGLVPSGLINIPGNYNHTKILSSTHSTVFFWCTLIQKCQLLNEDDLQLLTQ